MPILPELNRMPGLAKQTRSEHIDGRLFSKKYRIDWSFLQIYKKQTDVSL
jgi:hypothetical protein